MEDVPIKVALMGCIVNGPGEAREADIGIAGGRGEALLFSRGKILQKIPEDSIIPVLIAKIKDKNFAGFINIPPIIFFRKNNTIYFCDMQ